MKKDIDFLPVENVQLAIIKETQDKDLVLWVYIY